MHQHHQTRQGGLVFAQTFQPDFCANQGFDAPFSGLFIELDRAKQIAEVSNGQSGLPVGSGRLDDIIDAIGTVDDGEFGVETQVNKHSKHCNLWD